MSLICNDLRVEIANAENLTKGYNTKEITDQIANLESSIKEQRLIAEKHEEKHERSIEKLNSLAKEKSRITDNLSKFKLLKKNYQSDIERLEFIEQSHDYTEQLEDMKCPICNTTMKSELINVDKQIYYIVARLSRQNFSEL